MTCPQAAVLIPFAHSVSAFYDVSVFLELISVLVGEGWNNLGYESPHAVHEWWMVLYISSCHQSYKSMILPYMGLDVDVMIWQRWRKLEATRVRRS
jgi:hypothetical protein